MKESSYTERGPAFYKKKQFLSILMGLFIISIMVFSVLYYGLDSTGQEKVSYKNLDFVQTTAGWQAYTDSGEKIVIMSNPDDVEHLNTSASFLSLNGLSKVYMSINPYDNVGAALQDFERNVHLSSPLVISCYEDNDRCADLPIKRCPDASPSVGVLIFKEANETVVTFENNCMTIEGKDLLKITDKLILDQYAE